jgi:hypothetical protein
LIDDRLERLESFFWLILDQTCSDGEREETDRRKKSVSSSKSLRMRARTGWTWEVGQRTFSSIVHVLRIDVLVLLGVIVIIVVEVVILKEEAETMGSHMSLPSYPAVNCIEIYLPRRPHPEGGRWREGRERMRWAKYCGSRGAREGSREIWTDVHHEVIVGLRPRSRRWGQSKEREQ